jgi:pyruvate dehydrogenase E2 component (dihydrolipoamide acetyltransferase)
VPVELKLPDLGENIHGGGVVSVLVKEGDTIAPETPVLEIETDKATIEVPSNLGGKISKIHVKVGDKAEVGQVLLTMEDDAKPEASSQSPSPTKEAAAPKAESAPEKPAPEKSEEAAPQKPDPKEQASGPREVKLPDLGENIHNATLLSVLVKPGDVVTAETSILEIETDKATLEVPAGVAGKVLEVRVKDGQKISIGEVVLTLEPAASSGGATAPPAEKSDSAPPKTATVEERKSAAPVAAPAPPVQRSANGASKSRPVQASSAHSAPASPTVRRLAREIGVHIEQVKGSGPRGRISHEDVKAHSRALLSGQGQRASGGAGFALTIPDLPDFTKFGTVQREAMSGIRKATAKQMGLAWSTIPMVTQFDKADLSQFEELRGRLEGKFKARGAKLTVTALLLKILASALKVFPKFNASLDLKSEEVVFKQYFNLGVAVDTERGLLVPVLKNVDRKNILELAVEMGQLAQKARDRKVSPDELQGASMTVTNLGGIGGTNFTPIVNPPEVAILGVSRSAMEPFWQAQTGVFVPKLMLPLSMSYDHRLIDGAEAARFLRWVCEALETPAMLIFEG